MPWHWFMNTSSFEESLLMSIIQKGRLYNMQEYNNGVFSNFTWIIGHTINLIGGTLFYIWDIRDSWYAWLGL